jgi:hypothetical protein
VRVGEFGVETAGNLLLCWWGGGPKQNPQVQASPLCDVPVEAWWETNQKVQYSAPT